MEIYSSKFSAGIVTSTVPLINPASGSCEALQAASWPSKKDILTALYSIYIIIMMVYIYVAYGIWYRPILDSESILHKCGRWNIVRFRVLIHEKQAEGDGGDATTVVPQFDFGLLSLASKCDDARTCLAGHQKGPNPRFGSIFNFYAYVYTSCAVMYTAHSTCGELNGNSLS